MEQRLPYVKYEERCRKPISEWMNEEEIWKDIKGWEEFYEVSTHGRVRNKKRGNFLTVIDNNTVQIQNKDSKRKRETRMVHHLMSEVFFPKVEEKEYEKELRPNIPKSYIIKDGYDVKLYHHKNNWFWECWLKK